MKKRNCWACAVALAVAIWPHAVPRAAPRCYPNTRFVVSSGGLVRDTLTQLMWQRDGSGVRAGCANGTTCTWAEAKAYCAGLVLGELSGFRLPTVKELGSLVDLAVTSAPTIDRTAFPDTPKEWFWTSSPYAALSGGAWLIHFGLGDSTSANVGGNDRVRCVR